MALPIFYFPESFEPEQLIELSAQESAHALKSRRLRVGSQIGVINGQGQMGTGVLTEATKGLVQLRLEHVETQSESMPRVIVATALPKGDRQKTIVDMLTQLGVDMLIPLQCEFSVAKVTENTLEKWQRIVIEACKQSQRARFMTVHSGLGLSDLIDEFSDNGVVFLVADQNAQQPDPERISRATSLVLLVGPEGGFSASELKQLESRKDVLGLPLSEHILRTETAAIAGAAQMVSFTCPLIV